jgi:hypothetical protein
MTSAERAHKGTRGWGEGQVLFIEVDVTTKLGVELHLELGERLLDAGHLLLQRVDFLSHITRRGHVCE